MATPSRSPVARALWATLGFAAVAVGGVGVILPGIPTTGPFILAAWCFSKSSPRFERWVLGLPGVGPMVSDYRAGNGMPRRAKIWAIGMLTVAVAVSAWTLDVGSPPSLVVVAVGAIGVYWILYRVPTAETVARQRALEANPEAY